MEGRVLVVISPTDCRVDFYEGVGRGYRGEAVAGRGFCGGRGRWWVSRGRVEGWLLCSEGTRWVARGGSLEKIYGGGILKGGLARCCLVDLRRWVWEGYGVGGEEGGVLEEEGGVMWQRT